MERIGNEVQRSLARTGGGEGLALAEITGAWPSAVGAAIARNAWPLRLARDRTLHVATSSATWAFELDRMAPEITARLAEVLGDRAPAGLRFRPGPVPESGFEPPARPPAQPRAPAPETEEAATAIAASIEDESLRDLVARAARASLGRGP
jgi:hypothetical protein